MFAFSQPLNIIPMPQKNNEWYTPRVYIEAAREVMGGIDLDPASCELANQTVRAARYYSKEDNGLTQEWHGCVWLNPPYGKNNALPNDKRSAIGQWVEVLVRNYRAGHIKQAVLLVTTKTDAAWFSLLWLYPICFPDHLIQFDTAEPTRHWSGKASHMHGTCFVYLGPHEHKFIEVFSQFGRIAKAIDTPRKTVVPPSLWEGMK